MTAIPTATKDPTRSLKLLREAPVKLYEVNDEFIDDLRRAVDWLEDAYPRTACLVELLLLTGMRIGEALALQWDDINVPARHITLRLTKSGKVRHVPISDACLKLLRRLVEGTADCPPGGWLFPSSHRNSLMTRPVRPWKRACQAVGLPLSFYTVQGLLGHSSIRMTERYAALAAADLLKASGRVSSVLGLNKRGVK